MTEHPLFIPDIAALERVPAVLDIIDDEFCFSGNFTPEFIDALCLQGYLPMAQPVEGGYILLIKLHRERCVLQLPAGPVPNRVKKKAGGLLLSVDRAFGRCLEGIARQHPDNWIHPPLAEAFIRMHGTPTGRTRLHSVELWEKDRLIAGEIGFAVGGSYCSLSGFHEKSGTGTVQLYATARLLHGCGFRWWDLGMEMEYKTALGARSLPRHDFLREFSMVREGTACLAADGLDVSRFLA